MTKHNKLQMANPTWVVIMRGDNFHPVFLPFGNFKYFAKKHLGYQFAPVIRFSSKGDNRKVTNTVFHKSLTVYET